MATLGEKRRSFKGPAILSHGFRPFFFLAAVFAVLAVPTWLAAFTHGFPVGAGDDALGWHAHEMLYGYLGAVLCGFLMTAIPNWTGRLPVMGAPLGAFVSLWLLGRIAMMFGGALPALSAGVDVSFLVALAGLAWREVLNGKNWRNLPVCLFVSLFALGNLLWHLERATDLPAGIGLRLGLGVAVLLMALVGGRIIPSFTTNWLMKWRQSDRMPAPFGSYDKATLAVTGLAVIAWLVAPDARITGIAFMGTGVLHIVRLARWRGWITLSEPLVAVLHVAYAWIPAGLLLIGLAILTPQWISPSTALHALTAGAIGQLTMAVMTRASLGHSGRELTAGTGTTLIYILIFLGAVLRVAAPLTGLDYSVALSIAGGLWCGGFLLFALLYGPMLFRARRRT